MQKKISRYGIIGNLHAAALIGDDGSVDWLCCPTLSSPSIFAALLDQERGGRFSITPEGEWDSVLSYRTNTNVLITRFRTETGICTLTDFMPVLEREDREAEAREHVMFRLIEVQKGNVRMTLRFAPRFDYGRCVPSLRVISGQGVIASGRGYLLALGTEQPLRAVGDEAVGEWTLNEGTRVALHLRYGMDIPEPVGESEAERQLRNTVRFWRDWLYQSGPGLFNDLGPHRDQVIRSLLALKLLYYEPKGTMAAAATTSLPETIGGVRNWDYRFSWVRDTSMALAVLFRVGHEEETRGYLKWLAEIIEQSKNNELQVLYGLDGSRDLEEADLTHLRGYQCSRPVRIGNLAAQQKQFSIYGHVMIAAELLAQRTKRIDPPQWHGLRLMCDYVLHHWQEPDSGIWEMRTDVRHYVNSKVMCWATLDRGVRIARLCGLPADIAAWEEAGGRIRMEVLEKGWSDSRQAFLLHYDGEELDGSALLNSLVEFLPFDDPRMLATVEAIRLDLSEEGFVRRYIAEDGLPGREGTFLICTLWLITNLARQGEIDEAELLLTRVDQVAGPRHLLAEEYDPSWREQLGNFPQAFSHLAYITAAIAVAEEKAKEKRDGGEYPLHSATPSTPSTPFSPALLAGILADLLRQLRDGGGSEESLDEQLQKLAHLLDDAQTFDPNRLESREEKTCFWVNFFNASLLQAVRGSRIRTSVKEIPHFFRRAGHLVADRFMNLDMVLHGILRGNRPVPGNFIPPLFPGDERLTWSLRPSDPRVIFAVSTASMSSPSLRVSRPETLDKDLDLAAEEYVAKYVRLEKETRTLILPALFRWYEDFGLHDRDVAVHVAHLARNGDYSSVLEFPGSYVIRYRHFDWRLDRQQFGRLLNDAPG